MPHDGCPKCIIDGGRFAAAARRLAALHETLAPAAIYLADIVTADTLAVTSGYSDIPEYRHEELRAFAELDCHRAAFIETLPEPIDPTTLMEWAHEHRLFVTGLFGGEYEGEYEIDVMDGIKKKGD